MTEKDLKKLFEKVEKKYLTCWKILTILKTKPDKSILSLQGILAECLFDLSNAYCQINKEKQDIISKKGILSESWFVNRQRLLSKRLKNIVRMSAIGKTMGDAFAWVFYRNDLDLLEKHWEKKQHPKNIMPTGYGGMGEMMFIKDIPLFDRYLVIYHGTTTILRLGDISFIDIRNFKVAGIGEMKTNRINKEKLSINILMNFTDSDLPINLPKYEKSKKKSLLNKLPKDMKKRLIRQTKEINDALLFSSKDENKKKLNKHMEYYHSEFETLLFNSKTNEFSYAQFDKGLLCVVYRERQQKLYTKFFSKSQTKFKESLDEVIPNTKNLLLRGSEFNNIRLNPLAYTKDGIPSLMYGAIPIFWWPIDIELIRKIIFQEYLVIMIYNPAHLLDSLERKCFKVIQKKGNILDFKIEKKIEERKLILDNLWFFIDLISNSLIKEAEIKNLILEMSNKFERITDKDKKYRFDLRIFQLLDKPRMNLNKTD